MIITESLAKGLKNRFFLEISDEITQKLKLASNLERPTKNSISAWLKYQEKFKKIFGKSVLIFYSGGSKRRPYFALLGISIDEKREFNQWNEKCLTGHMVIMNYEPSIAEGMPALFNVGEHAISRIYERANVLIGKDLQVDIFSILPEFYYIPIWSSFWAGIFLMFKSYYSNLNELNQVYPVIPSKSGLFLGQITYQKLALLELRTFVDDKNLNFQQEKVKKILLKICNGFESSPLSFYPLTGALGIDEEVYQSSIMCFELLKEYDLISSVIFHRVEDDKLRYKLKEDFKRCLSDHSSTITQEFVDLSRRIGIRALQLEIKKESLKAHMPSKKSPEIN
jgi:hypothetical protein